MFWKIDRYYFGELCCYKLITMSRFSVLLGLLIIGNVLTAQVHFTKSGNIQFESETPIEKIQASNSKAVSIIDFTNQKIEFSVLMKGFHFENALMQTHFNENYLLSDEYPKAVFKSTEVDLSAVNLTLDGSYDIPLQGVLTVKGTEKHIDTDIKLTVNGGVVKVQTSFIVSPSDFEIEIPNLVKDNIAKEIHVFVEADYQPYEKK